MSEKRLQKRDEISDEYKWKLEDMYETDEAWSRILRRSASAIQS